MGDRYLPRLEEIINELENIQSKTEELQVKVKDLHDELKADEFALYGMSSEEDLEALKIQANELYEKF